MFPNGEDFYNTYVGIELDNSRFPLTQRYAKKSRSENRDQTKLRNEMFPSGKYN